MSESGSASTKQNVQLCVSRDRHKFGPAPGNGLVYLYSPTKTPACKIPSIHQFSLKHHYLRQPRFPDYN